MFFVNRSWPGTSTNASSAPDGRTLDAKPRSIVRPRAFSSAKRSGSVPVSARTSDDLPWSTWPAVATTCTRGDGTVAVVTSRIEALLAAARADISRIDVDAAEAKRQAGALFVDTRSCGARERFGSVPGAVVIDRNVLEWRVDPTSDHRDPDVAAHDGPIVVFCQQGYSSSLAVKTLTDLGVRDVHDLAGGFEAWTAAGLPVTAP